MTKVDYIKKDCVSVSCEPRFTLVSSKSRFINIDNVTCAETISGMLHDESGQELGNSTILELFFVDGTSTYTLLSDELNVILNSPSGNVIHEYNYPTPDWNGYLPPSQPVELGKDSTVEPFGIYCVENDTMNSDDCKNKTRTRSMDAWN